MKFKIVSLFFLIQILPMHAADIFEKNITLSALIKNSEYYSYSITKFGFENPNLVIAYDEKENKFESKSTVLYIETDIPVAYNPHYAITASVLESSCEDEEHNMIYEDFAKYYIDGKELKLNIPIIYDSFSDTTLDYVSDLKEFTIEFNTTPLLDIWQARCKGNASIYIELAF